MALKPITGISPSELNRRVTLESPARVADGMGGFAQTWTLVSTVWAKITTLRSTEAITSMQQTGEAIHNVVIRYRSDVLASWRIGYGGKYYAIIGPPIDLNKAHRFLDIKCKEVA